MQYTLLLTLLAAATWTSFVSGACTSAPLYDPGTFTYSTINTTYADPREYAIWVPEDYEYDNATGVVFSYHGASGTIKKQRALDGLTEYYFNQDYIVVYLQGVENTNGDTTWEGAPGAPADDLAFTRDLLDLVESQFCIDADRIYATGKSQGGGFVGAQLACSPDLSQRFAAFAPVSGAYYNANITDSADCDPESMPIPCSPGRSDVPILAFHGGNDNTIAYTGGYRKGACLPDVQYWVEEWAARDNVGTSALSVLDIDGSEDGFNRTYGGGLVTLVYDGDNIGHDWPATYENSDNKGKDLAAFNATTWIMGFFNAHPL